MSDETRRKRFPGTKNLSQVGRRILQDNRGFSLVEMAIAVILLAVSIAPLAAAYAPAVNSTGREEEMVVFANQARATLNRLVALDFSLLDGNRGSSVNLSSLLGSQAAEESFQFRGQSYTPSVSISDVSSGSGGLLEITVTAGYIDLTTLTSEY